MNTAKKRVVAGVALALLLGSAASSADEDSAYQWGRWAVLSPAAGGEPYVERLSPAAANNLRPNDIDGTTPEILSGGPGVRPPVPIEPPIVSPIDDPRDRLPPRANDPRDRLPPRPPAT